MKKQKALTKAALHLRSLHHRRAGWFAVLIVGLLLIQLVYNLHAGQPRVLGYSARVEQSQLIDSTNQSRSRNGLVPLKMNEALTAAAQAKAADMATKGYWSHIAPDGTTPWKFLEKAGYHYQTAGENLAYGFVSSDEVVSAWMSSEAHRANILGQYSEVGFGIQHAPDFQGGDNLVVVAFYGKPAPTQQAAKNFNPWAQPANTQRVSGLAVVAAGGANWSLYASFGLLVAAAVGFMVTHLELLRLGWYRSKRYLALHPVADAALIVVVALALVYTASGFIL